MLFKAHLKHKDNITISIPKNNLYLYLIGMISK